MERRRYPRRTVNRPAKFFVPGGGALPCRIYNVSRGGAKLGIGWKGWLPDAFYLQDAFTGVRRAARIVWRGLSGFGVRFTRAKPAEPQEPGFGRRRR
jgi:PilZ domain